MRACPYCAEQIQDAALFCRFCGRGVAPVRASRASGPRLGIPGERWYRVDPRVRQAAQAEKSSSDLPVWSKLGGAAMNAIDPTRRPENETKTRVRRYASRRNKP